MYWGPVLRYQARSMASSSSVKRPSAPETAAPRTPAARPARPTVKRRPRRRDEDPIPVISGRMTVAVSLIGALILIPFSPIGRWIERKGPANHDLSAWRQGEVSSVRLTLITADYNLLDCASPTEVGGAHCAFKAPNEAWPRDPSAPLDDNKANLIQPYRTVPDDKLILVAGVWNDPAVAMRLHREPPNSAPAKKLVRFVANCQMKFIGRLEDARLRWNPSAEWVDEGASMVARPEHCEVETKEP
jgi:hypothetical protein